MLDIGKRRTDTVRAAPLSDPTPTPAGSSAPQNIGGRLGIERVGVEESGPENM